MFMLCVAQADFYGTRKVQEINSAFKEPQFHANQPELSRETASDVIEAEPSINTRQKSTTLKNQEVWRPGSTKQNRKRGGGITKQSKERSVKTTKTERESSQIGNCLKSPLTLHKLTTKK